MHPHRTVRRLRLAALAALGLLLGACGTGLEGSFQDQAGMTRLDFHGDGTVVQHVPMVGIEKPMAYTQDGEQVRIVLDDHTGATLVLTRIDADTLAGPMGVRFERLR